MSESKVEVGEEVDFKVPKMGESITEGSIISWAKNEGDHFEEGETLVEIGTDKVDNEVPAPFDGQLVTIKANPDDVVEIGQVIATLKSVQLEKASEEKESAPSVSVDNNTSETYKEDSNIKKDQKKSAPAIMVDSVSKRFSMCGALMISI